MCWGVDLPYIISHSFVVLTTFSFIVLASRQIGTFLSKWNLPLISGYLLTGIIAGPFVLSFIDVQMLNELRFLEEISLAFIAFAAGSEMYLEELHGRYKSIGWNTVTQLVAVYLLAGIAIILLAEYIPFMEGLTTGGKLAVAILSGTILTARSPSSAIAIINEVRARGPFTKTVLGVTLVKDVIVVILFALSTSIASTLLNNQSFNVAFILLVFSEVIASLVIGLLIGRLLVIVLVTHFDERIKISLILLIGYLVFVLSAELRHYTHDNLPFEILLEPLLICMIASFWLTNRSAYRDELRHLLHRVEMLVFVIFFTLVGDSLDIEVVLTILPIALTLFAIRLVALFIGGYIGGTIAGDPAPYNRLTWMAYITQAGVGLGLAKEVAIEFPQLGDNFTTLMVAVIVVSQLAGPPFFKFAIKQVGESHLKGEGEHDEIRDVLIVGIENQSRALADRLNAHNWQVILADIDPSHVTNNTESVVLTHLLKDISKESIHEITTNDLDAVVAMLHDDDLNLKLCELGYEMYGVNRLVVRLNDYSRIDEFQALGATIVYPSSAMVHLLDNVVRAPQLANLVLHDDPQNEIAQITLTDPDIDGLPIRDVILPNDVLVISIIRDGHSIVPHGYTTLNLHDEITLIGTPTSIEEVTVKLGY